MAPAIHRAGSGRPAYSLRMQNWIFWGVLLVSGLAVVTAARAEVTVSADVWRLARHIHAVGDSGGMAFAIVDKRAAQLAVFHADGRLAGSTAALLGSAAGDHTVPGVGERAQRAALQPGDATTPAGRFISQPGHNHTGEAVIWVDESAALAIHRLRPGTAHNARARRLASANPGDKRVSQGCVVVSVAFFESVVQPLLGQRSAVVYVMPERGLQVLHAGSAGLAGTPGPAGAPGRATALAGL